MANIKYSSAADIDMGREFLFRNYDLLRKENDSEFGVESSDDIVIRMIGIDQFCYILDAPGAHMFQIGGVWNTDTQNSIAKVNCLAKKYGIDEVYLFDFSLLGTEKTTIRQDITAHPSYCGKDKAPENPYAVYNYIYGEIVSRYLTNIEDWTVSDRTITFFNRYQDVVTAPVITEPFLFIYNKDNTIDNSPKGYGDREMYPIVYALELAGLEENCCSIMEDKIFSHLGEQGAVITPYTNSDYIISAFSRNKRGHAYKTEDAFENGEQINIQFITFQQFRWLLDQDGNFLFLFGGPWCAFTQGVIATINDFAVQNNVNVYMTDWKLDSKHPIDFWFYPRKNEPQLSQPVMMEYYVEIWEKYLPAVKLLCSMDSERFWSLPTKDYVDKDGRKHTVLFTQIPLLFAYDRDRKNQNGKNRPAYASCHVSGELINTSERYVYYGPFYRMFKASCGYVFEEYKLRTGEEYTMPSQDRTKPIVPGQIEKHPETPFFKKEYDWYKEDIDKNHKYEKIESSKPVPEEEEDSCVAD